ncbi:hypothetical protein PDN58_04695 [Bacillus cereus]|nr:hypothetical protein [Bacillus cereus]MDA2053231.1 hypothetical protein [Bacillus cereus]
MTIKTNIKEILNIQEEIEYENVRCFEYSEDNNKCKFYIFTCFYNNEKELKDYYQTINDIIAFDFQRKLLLDVEKWNLYVFYFVKGKISEDLKTLIEENKYATRKIVYDNIGETLCDNKIKEIILNKLFRLDLAADFPKRNEMEKSLEEIIQETDESLLKSAKELLHIKGNKKEINQKKTDIILRFLEMKKDD